MSHRRQVLSSLHSPELAHLVLERHWNQCLPINPVAIAARLGVAVLARGSSAARACRYSGRYRMRRGRATIEVNVDEAPALQRFIVAHELGHHVLGHRSGSFDVGAFLDDARPAEQAANRFALELLMPEHVLRAYFFHAEANTLQELADYFGVSAGILVRRLNVSSLAR